MKTIVLFASGSGSNVENIHTYFKNRHGIKIEAVLSNNPRAGVLDRCARLGIPALTFNRAALYDSGVVTGTLRQLNPSLIVLAGFLWKVPEKLVQAFPGRMINIHPALLPKYGGKGMYGMHVHRTVHESRDTETGITIHYVNEQYDQGAVIRQVRTAISGDDSPEQIAQKVHELEYKHYPEVIAQLLEKL